MNFKVLPAGTRVVTLGDLKHGDLFRWYSGDGEVLMKLMGGTTEVPEQNSSHYAVIGDDSEYPAGILRYCVDSAQVVRLELVDGATVREVP